MPRIHSPHYSYHCISLVPRWVNKLSNESTYLMYLGVVWMSRKQPDYCNMKSHQLHLVCYTENKLKFLRKRLFQIIFLPYEMHGISFRAIPNVTQMTPRDFSCKKTSSRWQVLLLGQTHSRKHIALVIVSALWFYLCSQIADNEYVLLYIA